MAQIIKIKRSTGSTAPGTLNAGELAFTGGNGKLFIGDPANSNAVTQIGGYTWDSWVIDNITLDGNTISTTSGDLIIDPATGSVDFATGGAIELKILDGSATSLTISEGSNNYITLDTSNSAEKITLAKDVYASQALYIDGNNSTSSGGVKITNGVIDLKNGGSDSKIVFYCSASNAHAQTLQAAPHSSSASNTLTLPGTGTILATQDGTETLTNKTLSSPVLSGTVTTASGNITFNPAGSSTVDMSSSRVTSVADPTAAQDAATKAYVDAVKTGLDVKASVRAATTANITISSALNVGDTLDGVTLADGDRVLVKDQTDATENGIYTAGAVPARSEDANVAAELTGGTFTFVEEGTVNSDSGFVFTHNGTPTLGSTDLTVAQFSGAGTFNAGDGLSQSGTTFSVNDDNITLLADGTNLRIKGITATAVGDLLIGVATNGGYTRLVKPTADDALLTMGTAGTASWTTTLDGGTF